MLDSLFSAEFPVILAQAIKSGAEAGSSLKSVTLKPIGLSESVFASSIIGSGQRFPKQSKIIISFYIQQWFGTKLLKILLPLQKLLHDELLIGYFLESEHPVLRARDLVAYW